jgi:hypothetical protein
MTHRVCGRIGQSIVHSGRMYRERRYPSDLTDAQRACRPSVKAPGPSTISRPDAPFAQGAAHLTHATRSVPSAPCAGLIWTMPYTMCCPLESGARQAG